MTGTLPGTPHVDLSVGGSRDVSDDRLGSGDLDRDHIRVSVHLPYYCKRSGF